jgi:ArsR family transcriptional regulator
MNPTTHEEHLRAENLAARMRVIADPSRLRLLSIIRAAGGTSLIGLVHAEGRLTQPTVTHHVRILIAGGLVTSVREGRYVVIREVPGAVGELADAIRGCVR